MEAEDVLDIWVNLHRRQRSRGSGKLFPNLVEMVVVDMGVTQGMDEFGSLVTADLCQHHRQQGVRSYVERDTKEHVGASLVQLATELTLSRFPDIPDIELEKAVTRRQGHLVNIGDIPGAHYMSA